MRKNILTLFLACSLCVGASAVAGERDFTVAVFGDSPYGSNNADTAQFDATPAFIAGINADPDVSLVMHVGDIHSGKQFCLASYDGDVYAMWSGFVHPVLYTPGDNEWTDCHKSKEGGGAYNPATGQIDYVPGGSYANGNPVDNLALVRSIFFANPGHSTIAAHKEVISQAKVSPRHSSNAAYAENVVWEDADVLFASVNIPGGSNNDTDPWYGVPADQMSQQQKDEVAQRTKADLDWIDFAFSRAQREGARAVVIQVQADMWDLDGNSPGHIAGYRPFIDRIAAHARTYGRPVLLLNGDSHGYRSDNPLMKNAPCLVQGTGAAQSEVVACSDDAYDNQAANGGDYHVPNFHRIVVHGSNPDGEHMEWLELTIGRGEHRGRSAAFRFGPFSWQRMVTSLPN